MGCGHAHMLPQVMMPEFIMAHFADMLEGNAKKNARRAAMRRREGIVKKPKSEVEVKQRCA